MNTVLICYFLVALVVFGRWFILFWNDSTTPFNDRISWIILVLAPLCWPITLPLSILRLITRPSKNCVSLEKSLSIQQVPYAALSSKTKVNPHF